MIVYFFGFPTDSATSFSLVIVTISSLVGMIQRFGTRLISYREALVFVFPSMLLAFLIRKYRKIIIPDEFDLLGIHFTRNYLIDIILILVMLFVSYKMVQSVRKSISDSNQFSVLKTVLLGFVTGALSGFLGAGGGFIIVPILMSMGLEIKRAVATSLFIITIQSAIALIGDFSNPESLSLLMGNWKLLLFLTIFSITGVFIGSKLQHRISAKNLRKLFAYILITIAILLFVDRILLFHY